MLGVPLYSGVKYSFQPRVIVYGDDFNVILITQKDEAGRGVGWGVKREELLKPHFN